MTASTMDKRCTSREVFRWLPPRLSTIALAFVSLTGPGCTGEIGASGEAPDTDAEVDSDGDGQVDGFDTDGDGKIDDPGIDTDGDGIVDAPTPTGDDPTIPDDPDEPLENDPTSIAQACAAKNGAIDIGRTRLRRITRDQYDNTTAALLGTSGKPANAIAADERIGPFHSNAITPIDSLMVEQYQSVAAELAADARTRMAGIAPCDLGADTGTTCPTQFIEQLGLRAYRRPLEASEVENYLALYQLGQQNSGAERGFELVVEAMLQSPFFLYHVDVGVEGAPSASPVPVTPYELASRLSYFLWNSMPDEGLFALASSGTLTYTSTLASEVDRMIADPKASPAIALFHRQWLGLSELPERDKDPDLYPAFAPELVDAMVQETAFFSDYVIRQGDSLLSTLLTANFSFPQAGLFDVYGVAEPADFTPGTRVDLDATQRAGILTQAAFLTRHAHRDQTSPVHRGLVIRENVLCQTIDPPPANVNNTPPAPTEATSTRERFAQHSTNVVCATCHELMDPIGLGFENYDAVGAWRTQDGRGAVDASGSFEKVAADLEGDFTGAVELATKLAASSEVESCVANQWFRFALGRIESASDACSISVIHEGFSASGGNIRLLMTEIANSEAFRYVRAAGEETGQ